MQSAPADASPELERIHRSLGSFRALFRWYDGPLVEAMKRGHMLLVDEISLAEDAVLERLNSVLDPSRTILLAEKGSSGEVLCALSLSHSLF